jgi:hypothetical protein
MMSVAERQRVLEYLDSTRFGLLKTLDAFPEECFSTAPGEGCWSAALILEHVVFVEGRALGRIQGALQKPAEHTRRSAMEGRDEELFTAVRSRGQRIKAPSVVIPTGGQSRDQLVAGFLAAREATIEFAQRTEADLRVHFATHPVFGEMDCYQWLMLIPSHCERHRAQIEECLTRLR